MPSTRLPDAGSLRETDLLVLLGGLLPPDMDPTGTTRVLSETEVEHFPTEVRPTFAFFARTRTRSEARAFVVSQGGVAADVDRLVADGILARLPTGSTAEMAAVLARLRVLVTGIPTDVGAAEEGVLVTARDGASTRVSHDAAALLAGAAGGPALETTVHLVSQHAAVPESQVWDVLVPALTALLAIGAACLVPEAVA